MASEGFMRSDLIASSICDFIWRFNSFSSYCTESSAWPMVEPAHDVLVSTHEEEAQIVRLELAVAVGVERVQRERVAHVAEVNELVDLAVGIAGDVHQRGFAGRPFAQAADRHNGKQLAQRPVIQQRLEDGKIAEVLVAETVFELADFFGHRSLVFESVHHL